MRNDFDDNNFVKPDAEEYKKNKKAGFNPNKYTKSNNNGLKNRIKNDNGKNEKENNSKRDNIIFVVSVCVFLVILIVAKVCYSNMQKKEISKLSKTKWYVNNEADIKKMGYLEIEFNENGTFDMYKADSQVTCMNGTYSILYSGVLSFKSDKRGFNPPDVWNCKTKSRFKYKIDDDKMVLTYKGKSVTFYKQGGTSSGDGLDKGYEDDTLHKKYFVNEQAKMLVTFYMDNMYMYNLDDVNNLFGNNHEVLGDICLSGMYTLDQDKKKLTVNVDEESAIESNPMWESMTERKKYEFYYELGKNNEKIVLQYNDKAYEFKNEPIDW